MDTDAHHIGLESQARARSAQEAHDFPVSGNTLIMHGYAPTKAGSCKARHKTGSLPAGLKTGSRLAGLCGLAALLTACGTYNPDHPVIDHSVHAKSQNSRVQFVVLHYTSADNKTSLRILSQGNVSSHYLVTNEARPHVYELVDENRRAWHAGVSEWYGRTDLNSSSIGIEIVNAGRHNGTWAPYPPTQIRVVAALLKDIIDRHQIKPAYVVGHSDIAPQRKIDPGPLFPWKELAAQGIGRWYQTDKAVRYTQNFQHTGLPDIPWVQQQLARVGYACPQTGVLDQATKNVIAAFQMHYRPENIDGLPDAQTLGILKALP